MVPAVAGLKKQGANDGSCLAFLISTPESGVDSIALTYSLLDPLMSLIRPLTAFVTGAVAGILQNIINSATRDRHDSTTTGGGATPVNTSHIGTLSQRIPLTLRIRAGLHYAFTDLVGDIAGWFLVGLFLAGLITALIPDELINDVVGSGILVYLLVLAVSLPMYICATMSTPIAAALILKGLSPGAALILLMAGPATNVATITMVLGLFGSRTLFVYLSTIILCTIGAAALTDWVYSHFHIAMPVNAFVHGKEIIPHWLEFGASLLLGLLLCRVFYLKLFHKND